MAPFQLSYVYINPNPQPGPQPEPQPDYPIISSEYLTLIALEDNAIVRLENFNYISQDAQFYCRKESEQDENWDKYTFGSSILLNKNQYIQFKGLEIGMDQLNCKFYLTGTFNMEKNIKKSFALDSPLFNNLFENCNLVNVKMSETDEYLNIYFVRYQNTFKNCNQLSSIEVKFTRWNFGEDYGYNTFTNWVQGVSPTGVFYCPSELPIIYDNDHIPEGWTVITY